MTIEWNESKVDSVLIANTWSEITLGSLTIDGEMFTFKQGSKGSVLVVGRLEHLQAVRHVREHVDRSGDDRRH
jgi:hypothetical protein